MDSDTMESLIINKYSHYSFPYLYKVYKEKDGTAKRILGNLLAKKLCEKGAILDSKDLDDILDCAELDTLWNLYSKYKKGYLGSECLKRIEEKAATEEITSVGREKREVDGSKKVKKKGKKKSNGGKK